MYCAEIYSVCSFKGRFGKKKSWEQGFFEILISPETALRLGVGFPTQLTALPINSHLSVWRLLVCFQQQ